LVGLKPDLPFAHPEPSVWGCEPRSVWSLVEGRLTCGSGVIAATGPGEKGSDPSIGPLDRGGLMMHAFRIWSCQRLAER